MAEDTFRPERRKISKEELGAGGQPPIMNPGRPDLGASIRKAAEADDSEGMGGPPDPVRPAAPELNTGEGGIQFSGKVPKEFLQAVRAQRGGQEQVHHGRQRPTTQQKQQPLANFNNSTELQSLLSNLKEQQSLYEAIELPSKGRFYDGENGPSDGIVHVRAMTGEEEQILATPRFVRKGQAINMIFQRCLQESYRADELLTIDRTYLLIWLRGISYTPEYDVEVKCPECEKKFSTVIDLNSLYVDTCPDDFGPELTDVLPKSGYRFTYRLSKGRDEQEIQEYRDRRIKMFGDSSTDDTLTYRTALLLESIEGVNSKQELQTLVKNLPIQDVAFIRNCVNEPPFGVDTTIPINCPSCLQEFEVDLPLEANFFFPRRKRKEKTQA